jgi:hypothetical protein
MLATGRPQPGSPVGSVGLAAPVAPRIPGWGGWPVSNPSGAAARSPVITAILAGVPPAILAGVPSGAGETIAGMRIASIKPGDIVYANKKGRLFHAKVIGAGADGALIVRPIERNISYRQLKPSEIAEHWTHSVATRRQDRRPPTQTALDLDAAR